MRKSVLGIGVLAIAASLPGCSSAQKEPETSSAAACKLGQSLGQLNGSCATTTIQAAHDVGMNVWTTDAQGNLVPSGGGIFAIAWRDPSGGTDSARVLPNHEQEKIWSRDFPDSYGLGGTELQVENVGGSQQSFLCTITVDGRAVQSQVVADGTKCDISLPSGS